LADRQLLRWVLDRLARADRIDQLVVATSTATGDDVIADLCQAWDISCFRGSENDVLGRFIAAAKAFDAKLIVRVNADNPFVDPGYADILIDHIVTTGAEYASYQRQDGKHVMLTALSFFTEVLTMQCLQRAAETIGDQFQREHVTLGIYNRPDEFDVRYLPVPDFCNDPRLRFTVDTPDDLAMLREIFSALGQRAPDATAEEIVSLVNRNSNWLDKMAELNNMNPKSAKRDNTGNQ